MHAGKLRPNYRRWRARSHAVPSERRRIGASMIARAGAARAGSLLPVLVVAVAVAVASSSWSPDPLLDTIIFGNTASEAAHQLEAIGVDASPRRSDTCRSPCRTAATCRSGWPISQPSVTFRMKVDPAKQTYLTVKFDGSAASVRYAAFLAQRYWRYSNYSFIPSFCSAVSSTKS